MIAFMIIAVMMAAFMIIVVILYFACKILKAQAGLEESKDVEISEDVYKPEATQERCLSNESKFLADDNDPAQSRTDNAQVGMQDLVCEDALQQNRKDVQCEIHDPSVEDTPKPQPEFTEFAPVSLAESYYADPAQDSSPEELRESLVSTERPQELQLLLSSRPKVLQTEGFADHVFNVRFPKPRRVNLGSQLSGPERRPEPEGLEGSKEDSGCDCKKPTNPMLRCFGQGV